MAKRIVEFQVSMDFWPLFCNQSSGSLYKEISKYLFRHATICYAKMDNTDFTTLCSAYRDIFALLCQCCSCDCYPFGVFIFHAVRGTLTSVPGIACSDKRKRLISNPRLFFSKTQKRSDKTSKFRIRLFNLDITSKMYTPKEGRPCGLF